MQFQDYPAIVGPTYSLPSLNAECQRCMNLFLEGIDSGKGGNVWYLTNTPGTKSVIDFHNGSSLPATGTAPAGYVSQGWHYTDDMVYTIQAMFTTSNDRSFFISGNCFFELIKTLVPASSPPTYTYSAKFRGNLCPLEFVPTGPPGTDQFPYGDPQKFQMAETQNQLWVMLDRSNRGGLDTSKNAAVNTETTSVPAGVPNPSTVGYGLTQYDLRLRPDGSGNYTVKFPYIESCWNKSANLPGFQGIYGFYGLRGVLSVGDALIHIASSSQGPLNKTTALVSEFQYSQLIVEDIDISVNTAIDTQQYIGILGIEKLNKSPDIAVGAVYNGTDIWFFGPYSYEIWYLSGTNVDAPFSPISGAAGNIGCIAYQSLISFRNSVFWLGASSEGINTIWMSNGYTPTRISTTPIENEISLFSNTSDAIGWSYKIPGHACYVITFPTGGKTYAYDIETSQWHELSFQNETTGLPEILPISFSTFFSGKNLLGDLNHPKIYEYDTAYLTYDTSPIQKFRRTPGLTSGRRAIAYRKLEYEIEPGVGLVNTGVEAAEAIDPVISMRWSSDSAKTWGNYHTRRLGKSGEYKTRVIFNNLGATTQRRVYEIYMDAPVRLNIISAELGLDIGNH